jgi:acetyl-CoA synthetase (ADP-forming)
MKSLNEYEAENFLEKNKFKIAKRFLAKNPEQAMNYSKKLGFPVALKIIGKNILHKSDIGGVFLDLQNESQVKESFQKLKKIKNFKACLVQKYIPGEYVLIGLKKDPSFGHVLVVGLGGIYTEIIKDVSFRVCPINKKDALEMLKELKSYKLLTGIRGQKQVNINKIVNIITKVSSLSKKYPKIKELDINPLVVNEKDAVIVDARIVFD